MANGRTTFFCLLKPTFTSLRKRWTIFEGKKNIRSHANVAFLNAGFGFIRKIHDFLTSLGNKKDMGSKWVVQAPKLETKKTCNGRMRSATNHMFFSLVAGWLLWVAYAFVSWLKNQATITRKIMFLVAEKKQFHQLSCRFQRISGKSWAIYLDHQETENLINLSF